MKLMIEITEYNKEWIENASEIPQEISVEIANAIRNGEQKTGHWIEIQKYNYQCSECGQLVTRVKDALDNFCLNCGADMRRDEV